MRFAFIFIALLLAGCSDSKTKNVVKGPEGVVAELIETRHEASAPNNTRIDLVSKHGGNRTTIFNGTDGSRTNVFFKDHLIIIQYCYPTNYDAIGYIYSVGNEYAYSDIRITVATVDSVVDGMHLCRGGIGN